MITIPADLDGPQGDLLQQVLVGNETFFAAQTTMDGEPVYLVLARGDGAVRGVRALLFGTSSAAPSRPAPEPTPEPVQRIKPGWPGGGPAPTPVATGGASSEPSREWDVTHERVVEPEP